MLLKSEGSKRSKSEVSQDGLLSFLRSSLTGQRHILEKYGMHILGLLFIESKQTLVILT